MEKKVAGFCVLDIYMYSENLLLQSEWFLYSGHLHVQ